MSQGLALPALSKQGQLPAFFRMLESGLLDEPLFSIWLSPDPTLEPAGKILFGGHNPARYTGELLDLPVISKKCAHCPFLISYVICKPHSCMTCSNSSRVLRLLQSGIACSCLPCALRGRQHLVVSSWHK